VFSSPRALAVLSTFAFTSLATAGVDVTEKPDRVRVEIGGKLFTEFVFKGAPHVYYWPVLGPHGLLVTRAWPMEEPPGEEHDHPHHRSMWFSHGAVNGIDFWGEAASYKSTPKFPVGKIEHDKILETKSGSVGIVKSSQKWNAPDGTTPLTSVQTLTVHDRPDTERVFDFEITLTAGDKDVVLGDTKEGSFGIRIAESMRLKGSKEGPKGEGHIANSEGQKDGDVWGKRAKWVDMSGPVEGKTFGIAIFENPGNPRYPTRWHARDYGLFAANPFLERDADKTKPEGAGDFPLKAGQSLTLKYRVFIHEGDAAAAKVAERYDEYLKSAR
jgi:hypothetical protein